MTLLAQSRQALRRLRRNPAFALASVGTLTLAIAANGAIYGVVRSVVLRPLPYPEPNRLVWLDHSAPGIGASRGLDLTGGLYAYYQERARTLESMAGYEVVEMNLAEGDQPERVEVAATTASFATTLEVTPDVGRFFTSAEDLPGAAPVAVMGHGLWARHFGTDPGIVGRTIRLDGVAYELIGVMPQGFAFPTSETALWIPRRLDPAGNALGSFSLHGFARLAPGYQVEDARREIQALIPGLAERFPSAATMIRDSGLRILVDPLKDHLSGNVRRALWLLMAAVAFVVIIAGVNVAALFLVRAESGQRDLAIRSALGAGRMERFRQAGTEATVLTGSAWVLGIMLAWEGLRLLRALGPEGLPRRNEIGMDASVLAVTVLVSVGITVALGLVPAFRRVAVLGVLRATGRGLTAGRPGTRLRGALVAAQVAMAFVLISGAGLMLRSLWRTWQLDPGFRPANVLTFDLGLSRTVYPSRERAAAVQLEIMARIRALPGVTSVGATTCLPLCGRWAGDAWQAADAPLAPGELPPVVATRRVSRDYFETLGIPLIEGRPIVESDVLEAAPVAVVSLQAARRLWPGRDPLGRLVTNQGPGGVPYTVVGVVANTPIRDVTEDASPMIYLPLLSHNADGPGPWLLELSVGTRLPPPSVVTAIRREVLAVDPGLPVARVRTMDAVLAGATAGRVFTAVVLGVAASVGLLLGMVGLYGVVAHVVSQRSREFGVRLAVGATSRDIIGMMLRYGGVLVGLGLAAGVVGSLFLGRLLQGMLFGVTASDPGALITVALALVVTAGLAVYLPARRGGRVDPTVALRAE